MTLTYRQSLFIAAFVGGARFNATAAARAAGYAWPDKQGPRLLQHPAVRAAIEARFAPLRRQAARMAARGEQGDVFRRGPRGGGFLFGTRM